MSAYFVSDVYDSVCIVQNVELEDYIGIIGRVFNEKNDRFSLQSFAGPIGEVPESWFCLRDSVGPGA